MKIRILFGFFFLAFTNCIVFAQGPGGGPPQIGGDGIWVRNAIGAEGPTFDKCHAHQPQSGEYHYHANPVCLRFQFNDNLEDTGEHFREKAAPWTHSPILGWAYDGFPIYGPYGFSDPNTASSPIKRMVSGFRLREITQRHTLAEWSAALHNLPAQLASSQYGPDVSEKYPLGWYVEDFDYINGLGDLDLYNGRFCVTPEFPKGTYAYFVTIDEDGEEAFPYVLGRQYYGKVNPGQVMAINEPVTNHFANGSYVEAPSTDPYLFSWFTKNSRQYALVISGRNPSAGPQPTWPTQNTPVFADIQMIRYSNDWVYLNAPGLASHVMGPWYDSHSPDGVFPNFPRDQHVLNRISRHPQKADTHTTNFLGPIGRWVSGVAVFNMLDGAGWSNSLQMDSMMPTTTPGDTTPPMVRVTAPAAGVTIVSGDNAKVEVTWTATDNVGVVNQALKLTGKRNGTVFTDTIVSGLPGNASSFTVSITKNDEIAEAQILIEASDAARNLGQGRSGVFTVTAPKASDLEKPIVTNVTLSKKKVKRKVDATLMISWSSKDNVGVVSHDIVYAGDARNFTLSVVSGLSGTTQNFTWTISSSVPKTTTGAVKVIARDAAGNLGEATAGGGLVIK